MGFVSDFVPTSLDRISDFSRVSIGVPYMLKILPLISLIVLNGCWYSFSEKPFPQIKTIGVIPFDNDSPEYDVATRATDLLSQKLLSSSAYTLAQADAADGIVSGRIIAYERKVNTYDEAENPVDYIIKVRIKLVFTERATGKVLLDQIFEGYGAFLPDGDETEAKSKAISLLIDNIYDKLKSG